MLLSPSSCPQVPKFLIKEAKLSLGLILECFQFIHIEGGEKPPSQHFQEEIIVKCSIKFPK